MDKPHALLITAICFEPCILWALDVETYLVDFFGEDHIQTLSRAISQPHMFTSQHQARFAGNFNCHDDVALFKIIRKWARVWF
jgi:hypothetical protein